MQRLVGLRALEVLVELALQGAQLAEVVLRDLGGQVLQNVLLHAPQQEGEDLPVKRLHRQHPCNIDIMLFSASFKFF